jgi:hypothetical protein
VSAHWDYILAAYGVAAAVLAGYRILLGQRIRAAEEERAALANRNRDKT